MSDDVEPTHDRRAGRPRQAMGSIIGFATIGIAFLTAMCTATVWVGSLDRSVSDMKERLDKNERENAAFTAEMRSTFRDVTNTLRDVQLEVARQPNVPPNRR